jgi:hypothetical protein
MSVTTEWSKLTNNDSKLAIYIDGRPYFWTCHAVEKENPLTKTKSRFVIVDNFLINLIKKFTNVDMPKDDSDKKLSEKKFYEGKVELQKKFGSDYDVLLQIQDLTNAISDKMENKKFNINGPAPLKG